MRVVAARIIAERAFDLWRTSRTAGPRSTDRGQQRGRRSVVVKDSLAQIVSSETAIGRPSATARRLVDALVSSAGFSGRAQGTAASRGQVGQVWARGHRVPGRLRATNTGRPPRDWRGEDRSGPARRAGGSRSGSSSREWPLVDRARGSALVPGGRCTSSLVRRGVRPPLRHHGFRGWMMRESRSARGSGASTFGSRPSSRRRGAPTPRAAER